MKDGKKIGLALSGGGYRAAAFHLGTLQKLHEMGLLSQVDVLSTISGGSITGAAYCLHQGDYPEFHNYMAGQLMTKNIIKEVLTSRSFLQLFLFLIVFLGITIYLLFTPWAPLSILTFVLTIFLLLKYQFFIFTISIDVEKAYDKFLYHNKTLADLNKQPLLAIGSSNLQTGRPFTFSQKKMADSTYSFREPPILFKHEDFPIARAVMASTCVPFAFTPVTIDKAFYKNKEEFGTINPQLVDGGVYDNQGIQKITQHLSSYECDIIITSDAGGGLGPKISFHNTIALLMRTVDVFMYRIKTMQMVEHIYQNVMEKNKPIAYFSLGWCIQRLIPGFVDNMKKGLVLRSVIDAHGLKDEWIAYPQCFEKEITKHLELRTGYAEVLKRNLTKEEWELARGTGTNLTNLSKERTDCLIRHAANLTELQVKLYCPQLTS
jgi:NTE family protein